MKYLIALFALLLPLALPSVAFGQPRVPADALVVPAGSTHRGDLATIDQAIVIDGVVEGDVTSIRGAIIVRGTVHGDVISLFGDVSFDASASTEGNVMAAVGKVNRAAPLELAQGRTFFSGDLTGRGMASLLPADSSQPLNLADRTTLSIVLAVMALIGATLLSVIWPHSIETSSRVVRRATGRAIGLGVLWTMLTGLGMLLLTALLIFTLFGVAVLPVVLLVVQVPYLIGLAVMGQTLGRGIGQEGIGGTLLGSLLVLVPVVLLSLVSLTGALMVFYIVAGIGVGALFLMRSAVLHRNTAAY